MPRFAFSLAVAAVALFATQLAHARITATAAIPPIQYLAERIGGESVQARALLESGQSPHTFDPTPRQMAQLADSKLYFQIGLPFEDSLLPRIADTSKSLRVIDLRHGLPMHPADSGRVTDHTETRIDTEENYFIGAQLADQHEAMTSATRPVHDHGESDPHIWLNPQYAMAMARAIAEALIEADSSNAATYRANLQKLLEDLEALDADLAERMKPFRGHAFYVFHPAYGHFAERYGLRQEAIEAGGKEPSAQHLAALITQARADKAKVILAQPQFSSRAVQTVADEIGATVLRIDPLRKDYMKMMQSLGEAMEKALAAE